MGEVSRRDFIKGLIGGLIVGGIVGVAGGYVAAPGKEKTITATKTVTSEKTVTKTVTAAASGAKTVTETTTTTVTKPVTTTVTKTVAAPKEKVKVGWIYVGPIGDYGWTYAHNSGRLYVEKVLGHAIETMYVESVPEAQAGPAIESLIEKGCKVIFTTSFGFMDPTLEAAKKHSDIWFWHCSGYKRWRNMGTYFAELYQPYYLCGIAAAAVSKTLKFGYVAAFPIPEVVRHINSWVLGIWEGLWHRVKRGELSWDDLKKVEVHVKWLYSWYDPPKATDAARTLVEQFDADVLAFTEDSPATLQVAEEYQKKGKKVWSYSHYSDMRDYGPHAHLMGQLVDWGLMYEYILAYYLAGAPRSMDLWWLMGDGGDTYEGWRKGRGAAFYWLDKWGDFKAHPALPDWAKKLILHREQLMKERYWDPWNADFWTPFFEKLTGKKGIVDREGKTRLEPGEVGDHDLLWSIDWFVWGLAEPVPKG